jgi:hypothetical protein
MKPRTGLSAAKKYGISRPPAEGTIVRLPLRNWRSSVYAMIRKKISGTVADTRGWWHPATWQLRVWGRYGRWPELCHCMGRGRTGPSHRPKPHLLLCPRCAQGDRHHWGERVRKEPGGMTPPLRRSTSMALRYTDPSLQKNFILSRPDQIITYQLIYLWMTGKPL